jgi:GNAT superfamily N-acetyltransferase
MLWRVRTTLADRPGALAALARHCGERSVNILGLQIFPGVEGVTDELVLSSPAGWTLAEVAALVESAGGTAVSVGACTEQALVDGPTRYLNAVRRVVHGADSVPDALAALLDAEGGRDLSPAEALLGPVQDVLEVHVAGRRVEVRRTTPFTATEHARATAFAEAVADLHERGLVVTAPADEGGTAPEATAGPGEVLVRAASYSDTAALMAMHGRCSQDSVYRHFGAPLARLDLRLARRVLLDGGGALVAVADGMVVGLATLTEVEDGRCELSLLVEDRWQRRGIGTRLLGAATRQAAAAGALDVVMRGPAESPAAIAMVFGSGLRARVKLTGDELVVTVSTRGLPTTPRGHLFRPSGGVSLHR